MFFHLGIVIYYSQNNIGSTTLLTDKSGNDIGQFLYTPFGEMWVEEASTVDISHITRFFTNQQYDKESGLYYYNARYYDPHLGSFITPDPAKANFNHYAYSSANPIKYTDPTGLADDDPNDDDDDDDTTTTDYSDPSKPPVHDDDEEDNTNENENDVSNNNNNDQPQKTPDKTGGDNTDPKKKEENSPGIDAKGDYPIKDGFNADYEGIGPYKHHEGFDKPVPEGTKIEAKKDMKIVFTNKKDLPGYGKYIVGQDLKDKTIFYLGAHLKQVYTKKEDVKKGDILALSGKSGGPKMPAHFHGGTYKVPSGLLHTLTKNGGGLFYGKNWNINQNYAVNSFNLNETWKGPK